MRAVLESRTVLVLSVVLTLAVPVLTVPELPDVTFAPVLLGLVVFVVGKYVVCPLRWRGLSEAPCSRFWHARVLAEAEIFGLATPGHLGGDLWRIRRLATASGSKLGAATSVGFDRAIGATAVGASVFLAGAALPWRSLLVVVAATALLGGTALLLHRIRPELLPRPRLPRAVAVGQGFALSVVYEASIAVFVVGSVWSTGYHLPLPVVLAAFGASQVAGAIPGPHGASPRDAALVVALVAAGLPLAAATASVAIRAILVWLPALVLGGASLLAHRAASRREAAATHTAQPALTAA